MNLFVINHFGEGGVLCRRAQYRYNGIKVCEYLNRELLDGFERWGRDDSEMEPFWQPELEGNEQEFSDPNGPLSRYILHLYLKIDDTLCASSDGVVAGSFPKKIVELRGTCK